MRILFTLHDDETPHAGGMGVASGLATVYRASGHDVRFLTFGDMSQRLPFRVKYLLFPEFSAWRLFSAAADVIDASCGDAWLWARLRRPHKEGPRPLLVTRSHGLLHIADQARRAEATRGGIDLSWKYPLYWGGPRLREVAASFRAADLCLFLNDYERDFAVGELGVTEERARIVDNGLPGFLLGLPFDKEAQPPQQFSVVHVGSYLPLKGVRYAVAAIETLFERYPQTRALFIGCGCSPDRVLGDFQPQNRARVRVEQNYRREQLADLLADQSVVLSATLKEGFPLGILEAMACGLPAVTAATPGPLQYVEDEVNGLIAPAADSEGLAAALERLIGEPSLHRRLRVAAYRTAQRYSWQRIGSETLTLYQQALGKRQRP